jgi:hypothetical protein
VLLLLLQLLRGEVCVLVPEAVTSTVVTPRGQLPAQRTSLQQQQQHSMAIKPVIKQAHNDHAMHACFMRSCRR